MGSLNPWVIIMTRKKDNMFEYVISLNDLQLALLVTLIVSVLCPSLIFLLLGQDEEKRKEEIRKENEINAIYFSILSELEQKKYLAKHEGE